MMVLVDEDLEDDDDNVDVIGLVALEVGVTMDDELVLLLELIMLLLLLLLFCI